VVAGRDIIVQFGLGAAPATFKVRVKRFLDAYLGPEAGPFGGRSTQIQMLNRWLVDPSSRRNALITAPAGRGKTSLVVHWINQLNDEWQVVFVPISIRFGTNRAAVFYQALAARLSEVISQPLLSTPMDAEAFYRDRVTELLDEIPTSGKKCLLVIDGLDEATGWALDASVLPSRTQNDLRVLISARLVAGDHDALRRAIPQ
jgi:ATP/maltotriose-dependent transcriptional regulator MalT